MVSLQLLARLLEVGTRAQQSEERKAMTNGKMVVRNSI